MRPLGEPGPGTVTAHPPLPPVDLCPAAAIGDPSGELRRQLADYAMAVDVLARIVECATETDVVTRVFEFFEELCAPTALVFTPVRNDVISTSFGHPAPDLAAADAVRALFHAGADHAWTASGAGFIIRVRWREKTLGLLLVDQVALPDRREEYLNLALALVGVVALAIANARTHQRLEEEAITDELTGVPNRRAATERMWEELSRSKRTGEPLAVLMLDLDHFKNVNDRYGHAVGDAVLRATAARMRGAVREYDVLCRMGGEEFVILAPRTDLAQAVSLGERVRQVVAESPLLTVEGEPVRVTVSGGAAVSCGADAIVDAILARADRALYQAKADGRNRILAQPICPDETRNTARPGLMPGR